MPSSQPENQASRPKPASLTIVDRWRDKDTYTIAVGTGVGDLRTLPPKNASLVDLPEVMKAKELAVFAGVDLPKRLAKRVAPMPRLLAVYYAFAEKSRGPTLVLTIGFSSALAGVVKDYDIAAQQELPDLSLQAIWNRLKAEREELEQHLRLFPEHENQIFADFQAALQGEERWSGPFVFASAEVPGLEATLPALAKAVKDLDPDAQCRTLILSDWAGTEGLRTLAGLVLERVGRSDINVFSSKECFHDAFRGVLTLRSRAAPVKSAADKVRTAVRRRAAQLDKKRVETIEQLVQSLLTRHHDQRVFFELAAELIRAGFQRADYEDIARLGGLELVEPVIDTSITPAELGNYEFRGAQPPENVKEFIAQEGKLLVARVIEPGLRLASADMEKKAVVELALDEPPLWKLARETEEKLGAKAGSLALVLGLARKGMAEPEQCLGLFDLLRTEKQGELLSGWLDKLGVQEIHPKGGLTEHQLKHEVEVVNRDKLTSDSDLTVDKVVQVGYRAGEKVLRKAKVEAHEKMDDLVKETGNLLNELVRRVERVPQHIARAQTFMTKVKNRSDDLSSFAPKWKLDLMNKQVQEQALNLLDALTPSDYRADMTKEERATLDNLDKLRQRWRELLKLEEFPPGWKADYVKPGVKWGKITLRKPVRKPKPAPTTDYRWAAVLLALFPGLAFLPYFATTSGVIWSLFDIAVLAVALGALFLGLFLRAQWLWKAMCWVFSAGLVFLAAPQVLFGLVPFYTVLLTTLIPKEHLYAYLHWAVLVPLGLCGLLLGRVAPQAWNCYAGAFRGRTETVVRESVNLREGADRYSVIKATLSAGATVKVVDSTLGDERWYSVRTPQGEGWIHSDAFLPYGKFRKVLSAAPVVDYATNRPDGHLTPGESIEVVDVSGRTVRFRRSEGRFGLVSLDAFAEKETNTERPKNPLPEEKRSAKPPLFPPQETSAVRRKQSVRIESEPKGASLTIDGTPWGKTPTTVDLELGQHRFDLFLPGYATVSGERRTVEPGASQLSFALSQLLKVRIDSKPESALVHIDGTSYGYTTTEAYLTAGQHTFVLTKEGYESHLALETVTEGKQFFNYRLHKK